MKIQLFLVAIVTLISATATLADDKIPTIQPEIEESSSGAGDDKSIHEEGPYGSALKEVEEIRQQLGPEYSIESKELGIERDRPAAKSSKAGTPGEPWPGEKLYREVRELVNKFRQDARHLEEMAAHAEQLSEFALADQLREMAHRQWESARELSRPRSTRDYQPPWQPGLGPTHTLPPRVKTPTREQPPQSESPAKSAPAYGVPSAPYQRFSIPEKHEPKNR